MLDYHNHLEKGELKRRWLDKFLIQADSRGITEYGVSEHSYLFAELLPLYAGNIGPEDTEVGRRQRKWFSKSAGKWNLADYFELLLPLRQELGLKIGLELDWFPGSGSLVNKLLEPWPWDYIIGSVHWLDGWVYDIWESTWRERDVAKVWDRYLEIAALGAESQCFNILGHADAIKIFHQPRLWPEQGFTRLAKALADNGVAAEVNTAFRYRGHSQHFCPDPRVLDLFYRHGVDLTFGSDAHFPHEAGMYQEEARAYARRSGYTSCLAFQRRNPVLRRLA